MKQFYITLFLFLTFSLELIAQTTPTGSSTEVGITSGELSVSLSGGANYSLPIMVPPGINGVVPQISLVYNSQSGNGVAGYGWNISGVSGITRIPSTKFHDGIIDPVDFDSYDRFAFNGQRLIVKSGTSGVYGANGTVYETESFSNIKVTSYGVHPSGANYGPAYFIVEYPDGSKAYYGNSTDSRSITDWEITYWENLQGVRISYTYTSTNNVLDIASIKYGTLTTTTPINEIKFNYNTRARSEQAYIGGQSLIKTKILSSINVIGNGVGFRNYVLEHTTTQLDYQQLKQITEKSGDNLKSYNPTVFEYGTSSESITAKPTISSLALGEINSNNSSVVSGDFDGDARMDFVLYPTGVGVNSNKDFWMFTGIDKNSLISPIKVNCGYFGAIFASNGLTSNGKMYHYQGVTITQADATNLNAVNFKNYYNSATGVVLDNTKQAIFPERWIQNCYDSFSAAQGKFFFSGDFNGDGLTDVMALDQDFQELYCEPDPYGGPDLFNYSVNSTSQFYFVDLDRRKTTNFVNYAGVLQEYFLSTDSKIETFDVNGDGKTDILHFKNGKVYVYTLNNSNQLEFLWKTTDADIKIAQPILSGDYNGDGKMDFIIAKSAGLYAYDYVKFMSTGTGFVKTTETYAFANMGNSSDGQGIYTCNLIPLDINADGKTDIVQFRSVFGQAFNGARVIMNVFKNTNSSFTSSSTYDTGASQAIRSYPLPVFLSPKTNNQYLSVGVISNTQLYTFDSQNDFSKDGLVKSITTGNGVKETITYSPLQQDQYEPFYTPTIFTETFPNIDIIAAPNYKIVTKLERQTAGTYKKQMFNYSGAVSNADGIGFLGFRATMRTNWYNDNTALISNISKNDISLRGANVENFSLLSYQGPTTATPSSYISRSVKGYNTAIDALQANKVFKIKNTSETQFNGLEGTSNVITTGLDQYNNPTSVVSVLKEGANTVQTNTTTITYKAVNVSPYCIGVPASKTISSVITGSTMTSEELYGYTNTTYGLLNQIKKKGDATTNYIIEDNVFDTFGNITKKTITATGLTPRVTSYVYDTSGRFLTKSTDVEGLSKTFDYNLSSGVLNSEINQNGLTTSYLYDSWFKKTKTTDYLGKNNTYVYTRSTEKTIITNTGDDNSSTEETYDDLGNKIKVKIKDVAGNFSSVDYYYDIYDRNYKISQPYSGSSPTQFNETKYDDYGRLIKSIEYTGKTTDISYSGLTTTVNENSKTKVSVKNAMGNVVSMTDTPGGTITYTYFANGNLKEADFAGAKTTITQDGWGRKAMLVDSTAGTYTYEYNDLSETTKETTPNGTITYVLDGVGKVKEKTIAGGSTTSTKTTYTYDTTTKLLLNTKFEDFVNGGTITNAYTYDASKRISRTVETTQYAIFTKDITYDAFGRVDTETSTAQAGGKSSSKKIRNTYKNGSQWQILDDATSAVLWQTNTLNSKGQVLTAVNGPIAVTNSYDNYGYVSQFKYDNAATPAVNILTLNSVFDAVKGNLSSRTNSLFSRSETFKYDALDRLTEFTNAAGTQETQTYDNRGRITQNSIGTYNYTNANKLYQNTSIDVTANALTYYTGRPTLNVTYNPFKSPIQIEETGVDKISFIYNDENDRSTMFYGGLQNDKLLRTYRKYYSADGTMEVKQNITSGAVDFVTYIGGDGYSAPLVLKSDGTTSNYLYLLRDYQGSITAIINQSGAVVEKRLFDAWGTIIKVQDGSGNVLTGLTILDRGYTGHEHLQSVGLIHMNGRLYDPKLHRFIQPDNNIQDPFNTQNYNRYGYVLNNPLRYTDPSGEFWHIVAGAVIGGVVNWGVHGFRLDMEGLKAFGIGAGAGALGAATGGAAFGLAGGAAAGGGGFAAGAFSGAVGTMFSSMALSVGNNLALGDPLMSSADMAKGILFGAVTGGLMNGVAALANGKTFWTGTTPRVTVQPMTLQTAGLTELENNSNNIQTGDYKISSTTEMTTSPTNPSNTSTNIDIDNGYVDLSKNPDFRLQVSNQMDMPQFSSSTIDDAVEYAMNNKAIHVFGKPMHNLDPLVARLGGQENTFRAVLNAANGKLPSAGIFSNVPVDVAGYNVIVRGSVINGVPKIGTMFIP